PGSDRGPQVGRDGREGDEDRRPQRGPHGPGSTDVLRVALRRTAGGGPEPQGGGGPRSAKGAAFHRRCPDHLLPARGTRAAGAVLGGAARGVSAVVPGRDRWPFGGGRRSCRS